MREWGLTDHAAAMGITLSPKAVEQLQMFLQLLAKWNRVYNITSLKGENTWVSHHLLDSLAIVPYLPTGDLIDVGTGGGFPGLPVAIAEPRRHTVLLDSNHKKTSFLRQVVSELTLPNVEVVTARVEEFTSSDGFAVVVSRAFSDIGTFIKLASHLCGSPGRMVAMKGARPDEELANLPPAVIEQIARLQVPTLDAERHVVVINPSGSQGK